MSDKNSSLSYKDAGVDIDAGNQLVERIKSVAKKTHRRVVSKPIRVEQQAKTNRGQTKESINNQSSRCLPNHPFIRLLTSLSIFHASPPRVY